VAARAEAPLAREAPPGTEAGATIVVVQPGQTLWRLAHDVYGNGLRYTVIYNANKAQIQDPDRIFPGQVFATPALSAPAQR
jgi:nucleoid-associated protein YgaU